MNATGEKSGRWPRCALAGVTRGWFMLTPRERGAVLLICLLALIGLCARCVHDRMARAIDIIHRELSKHYTEETFKDALTVAWQQARKFPCVADFHRGFDAPKRDDGPTLEELRIV